MAAEGTTPHSPTPDSNFCTTARPRRDRPRTYTGRNTARPTAVPGPGRDMAGDNDRDTDHGEVAIFGPVITPVVHVEQPQDVTGGTPPAAPQTGDNLAAPRADSVSASRRPAAVPGFIEVEHQADFLAGWAAGHAAAATCGPLPDELARDVVLILDTITTPASTPVPPSRRTGRAGSAKDAG